MQGGRVPRVQGGPRSLCGRALSPTPPYPTPTPTCTHRRLPIDLKTINAMMFIKFLTLEIETACADAKTVGSHAAEGLKLYPALKHFQKHYVDVEVSEYVPGLVFMSRP